MTDWQQNELQARVDELEMEIGRRDRELSALRSERDELERANNQLWVDIRVLTHQRAANAESAQLWEERTRKVERELEDVRRRHGGY